MREATVARDQQRGEQSSVHGRLREHTGEATSAGTVSYGKADEGRYLTNVVEKARGGLAGVEDSYERRRGEEVEEAVGAVGLVGEALGARWSC